MKSIYYILAATFMSCPVFAMDGPMFEEAKNYHISGKKLKEIIKVSRSGSHGYAGLYKRDSDGLGLGIKETNLTGDLEIPNDMVLTARWMTRPDDWYYDPSVVQTDDLNTSKEIEIRHGNSNNYLRGYWLIEDSIPNFGTPFSVEIDPEW